MHTSFPRVLTSICLSASLAAFGAELRDDHPLIGSWKITLPDGSCSETYLFRKDGTSLVTSAEEVAESSLNFSSEPSPKGFYKWVDKVIKDNGKKDCTGQTTDVGHESTNYILLHKSGNMFFMCQQEDTNSCIGPFIRMKGSDA